MSKKKVESRVGLQAASIFSSTTRSQPITRAEQQPVKQEPVAVKHEQVAHAVVKKSVSNTVKSTVTFSNDHIVWLDRLSSDIRATNVAIVDRGAIIRGIISAVEQSNLDLCNATSEEQIREIICEKLKR